MSYCYNWLCNCYSCISEFLFCNRCVSAIDCRGFFLVFHKLYELCQIVTIAMSQSMYFSSLDTRKAYFSILVDGPLQVLYEFFVLFSSVFSRSYTVKVAQKLIVCILPAQVLLALFYTLVNTGVNVATPPPPHTHSITVYKINSRSTFGSSAQTVNPRITAVTP